MRLAIVIPARMASTRFPGKPMIDLMGKPMVRWVVDAAREASITDHVVVATPDAEIADYCRMTGIDVEVTRSDHVNGTDRLAEVLERRDFEAVVNVQGDEPLIDPATIRACAMPMASEAMVSVYAHAEPEEESNPAVVKVVTDRQSYALYFSRWCLPYARNPRSRPVKKHIGIYAYRREPLLAFARWGVSELEHAESLEQLRFLENGVRIRMVEGKGSPVAVDTPEQAELARRFLAARGEA